MNRVALRVLRSTGPVPEVALWLLVDGKRHLFWMLEKDGRPIPLHWRDAYVRNAQMTFDGFVAAIERENA